MRSLVMALSIALSSASALPVQAASPDDLDRTAQSEICPADLRSYLSIPLSEACPENQLGAISPDHMNQCREDWSKDDLQKRAGEIGIEGRSKMSKGELVDALRNH